MKLDLKRQWIQIAVVPELLEYLMKSTEEKLLNLSIKGIPKDANLVGTSFSRRQNLIYLTFEHPGFTPIPNGKRLPQIVPEFTVVSSPKDIAINFKYDTGQ